MNRLMVDIETLGTSTRAAILSAGFVFFDGSGIIHSVEYFLNPSHQRGRHIEFKTVKWWVQQSEEARAAVFDRDHYDSPSYMVDNIARLYREFDCQEVWAKGVTFDIVLLQELIHGWPWDHRQIMCMRPLRRLFPHIADTPAAIKHSALSDAEAQAQWVIDALASLGVE